MDDASYYTKSKMMFDISDFYIGKPKEKTTKLKYTKKFKEDEKLEEEPNDEVTPKVLDPALA